MLLSCCPSFKYFSQYEIIPCQDTPDVFHQRKIQPMFFCISDEHLFKHIWCYGTTHPVDVTAIFEISGIGI
jgi:hypothetical protein